MHKQIPLHLSGFMLFLTILIQTEKLLAPDRHQKILGPANTYLASTSSCLNYVLIPFVFPLENQGIVHGPVSQVLGEPP